MDRRQALRNIGLGAGAVVATPTVISLLQSCTSEPSFVPVFVSPAEGHALEQMVDLIIPADETIPGAVAVGAHKFIDAYWNEVTPKVQGEIWEERYEPLQDHIKMFFKMFGEEFTTTFSKELAEGKPEEFDQMLSKYLTTEKETQMQHYLALNDFFEEYETDKTATPAKEAAVFGLLSGIRGMTIWAWKSSEQIGENVLWYDPVPGQQKGCIPISEAGNGNAMAL
jgi:hypothetical protein